MTEHHLTCVCHEPFNHRTHSGLYMDLYYLDPETPKMTFSSDFLCSPSEDGREIPLFLAAPLLILRDMDESFLTRLAGRPAFTPTPENPDCEVCMEVKWLINCCQTFDECKQRWCSKDAVFIFEVFKEILSRLKHKLIRFSRAHFEYTRNSPYYKPLISCPKGDQIEKQLDMADFRTFINMESYYLLNDSKIPDVYTDTFYLLMTTLIQIIRRYVAKMTEYKDKSVDDESYIFLALNLYPTEVIRGLNVITSSLAPSVIDVKTYYFVERKQLMFIRPIEEADMKLRNTMICMKNLLVCNTTKPYNRTNESQLLEDSLSDPEVKKFVREAAQL